MCSVRPCATSRPRILLVLVPFALSPGPATTQQAPDPFQLWSTVNVVGQATGEDAIRSEISGSLDIFSNLLVRSVLVQLYVEGSTTPRDGTISTLIPSANMDAGTALDGGGGGRIQLSELFVRWPHGRQAGIRAGLMDLTTFLDVSRIANDENLHFLGQPFVNNPTIVFPDYTLAAALLQDISALGHGLLTVTVSSSHGLADGAEASYEDLFDVSAAGKGAFAAGTMKWEGARWRGSVGAWTSTGERFEVDARSRPLPNRGLFAVVGWSGSVSSLSARLGLADGPVATEPFIGLTWLGILGSNAVGVGVARTPALPSRVDRRAGHAEGFVRHSLWRTVHLTSSLQWLSRSLLPGEAEEGTWIFGFRLSATF